MRTYLLARTIFLDMEKDFELLDIEWNRRNCEDYLIAMRTTIQYGKQTRSSKRAAKAVKMLLRFLRNSDLD
jgi:hypothetical protein